jgi:bifunctional DNA-binding transcriptional regulator/antitoxin component of YhaV-PrlF toxin-antitoxin module
MVQAKSRRKVVKTLAKGQITIPREFREALSIDSETLLSITLSGDHLEIAPLHQGLDNIRRYTDEEVSRFMEEDKIDRKTADKVRAMLKQGKL